MSEYLFNDKEFVEFTCGGSNCNFENFSSGLEFKSEELKPPSDFICLVYPSNIAKNFYTGVFISHEKEIKSKFTFFGSGIGLKKGTRKDYREIIGTEIDQDGKAIHYTYKWNNRFYVLKQQVIRK